MTDGGQSPWEAVVWALVLLVSVVGLVWEFGTSLVHLGRHASHNFPIAFIHSLQAKLYVLAILAGGGTLLAFVYVTFRYSENTHPDPESMPPKWKQGPFIMWIAAVIAIMLVTAMIGSGVLINVDSGPSPTSSNVQGTQLATEGSLTYKVMGVQWTWMVKAGHLPFAMRRTIRVPANTTIHLRITSQDVIHSFAIQPLGVKKDAVPGQWNNYYFVARETGQYQINCAELCGAGHSQMTPTLVVMPRDEYADWVVEHGGTYPYKRPANASTGAAPSNASGTNTSTTRMNTTIRPSNATVAPNVTATPANTTQTPGRVARTVRKHPVRAPTATGGI